MCQRWLLPDRPRPTLTSVFYCISSQNLTTCCGQPLNKPRPSVSRYSLQRMSSTRVNICHLLTGSSAQLWNGSVRLLGWTWTAELQSHSHIKVRDESDSGDFAARKIELDWTLTLQVSLELSLDSQVNWTCVTRIHKNLVTSFTAQTNKLTCYCCNMYRLSHWFPK